MTKDGLTCRGPLSHAEHARPVIRQNTVQNCADTCKLAAGHVTNPPELCDQAQQEMCPTSDQTSQHCHIAGFGCRCFSPDSLFLKMKTKLRLAWRSATSFIVLFPTLKKKTQRQIRTLAHTSRSSYVSTQPTWTHRSSKRNRTQTRNVPLERNTRRQRNFPR